MANDKRKTKKDLLGELESIKTLLDSSDDDIIDFSDDDLDDELPVLTLTDDLTATDGLGSDQDFDDHPHEDDIPVLTETFEAQPSSDIVDDLIKVDKELNLDTLPAPEKINAKKVELKTPKPEETKQPSKEVEGSLFDNLETEFKQQWQQDEDNPVQDTKAVSPEEQKVDSLEPPETDSLEATEKAPEPLPEKTLSKSEDNSAKKNEPTEKDSSENQPSLFDADATETNDDLELHQLESNLEIEEVKTDTQKESTPKPDNNISTAIDKLTASAALANTGSQSSSVNSSQTNLRPIKTDNPFLPKHIRDRLHTSRSLQDEIMDSPLFQKAAATIDASVNSTPEIKTEINQSHEQVLIDQLVASYLPKIEQELRERLQELVTQSTDDHSEN